MKKIQGFWFCNQPFKVHTFYLPHAPALLFVWDNYRPLEKNLSFKLHRMSPVLRSHSPTSGEQAHEPPLQEPVPHKSFAVTSEAIKTSSLMHKTHFLPCLRPTETMANSYQTNYIVYFGDTTIT